MDTGQPKKKNYKGANKKINPNIRDENIIKGRCTYAWMEDRNKISGEIDLTRTRANDPNLMRVYYRKNTEEWPASKKIFTYYDIVRITKSGTEIIGTITEHTTPERVDSLIYRYLHPDHMKQFTFSGVVRFSGYADNSTSIFYSETKTPYVTIPQDIVKENDVRVDDVIEITVKDREGWVWTDLYHVSRMSEHLIIPLTKFKRAIIANLPTGRELLFQNYAQYKEGTEQLKQGFTNLFYFMPNPDPTAHTGYRVDYRRFISPGDPVEVSVMLHLSPEGKQGRDDFAFETLLQIAKERVKMERKSKG